MLKFVFLPPQDEVRRSWGKRLEAELPNYRIVTAETDADARREIVDADGAYGQIPPDILPLAKKLRWLQSKHIAPPADFYYRDLIDHPLMVTNPRGTFNDIIAQHTMMYVLAFARGLPSYMEAQRNRRWDKDAPQGPFVDLAASTALIYGVGGIGQETAKVCAAFGMRVLGIDNRWEYETPMLEKHSADDLDSLLPVADFVIVTVPHTPETEGMWDADKFRLMKESAYFINIGRGLTTSLNDLVDAVETGGIAGCGLDVYETEPLPPDHKLWGLPNAIMTPHVAGINAPSVPVRQYKILLENLNRFANGETLINLVDKRVWY